MCPEGTHLLVLPCLSPAPHSLLCVIHWSLVKFLVAGLPREDESFLCLKSCQRTYLVRRALWWPKPALLCPLHHPHHRAVGQPGVRVLLPCGGWGQLFLRGRARSPAKGGEEFSFISSPSLYYFSPHPQCARIHRA